MHHQVQQLPDLGLETEGFGCSDFAHVRVSLIRPAKRLLSSRRAGPRSCRGRIEAMSDHPNQEMSLPTRLLHALLSIVAAWVIVACAAAPSPTNTTAWRDPDFKGPPFKRIFVVGLS